MAHASETVADRRTWIGTALVLGLVYVLIGRLFALPAEHVRVWRLAAWALSGVAFAGHIGYEHFRLRSSAGAAALHAALAVAIGGLGLALAGMVRSLATTSGLRPAWLLALVAWPALTAVPAFLVALAVGAVLARTRRS